MDPILIFGLVITVAFLVGIGLGRFGLPRVATYLLVGALFSGEMFRSETVVALGDALNGAREVFTTLALGAIAFLIGSELNLADFRRSSRLIFQTTLFEILGALIFTALGLWIFSPLVPSLEGYRLPIMLGAIAVTTAPAATIAIIDQYNAKGRLTDTVLDVVVLDDVFGILVFSVLLGVVGAGSLGSNLVHALFELLGSVVLGATLGAALGWVARVIRSEELRFPLLIGGILICVGLTRSLELSPILSAMILGFVARNFFRRVCADISVPVKHIEEFVFIVFFVVTGMHFNFSVFQEAFSVICLYVVLRASGKYWGARVGARWAGASPKVQKWVGFGLLPQAGVAVGLALTLTQTPEFSDQKEFIMNLILGSTIIYELVGPLLFRWALLKGGQMKAAS